MQLRSKIVLESFRTNKVLKTEKYCRDLNATNIFEVIRVVFVKIFTLKKAALQSKCSGICKKTYSYSKRL